MVTRFGNRTANITRYAEAILGEGWRTRAVLGNSAGTLPWLAFGFYKVLPKYFATKNQAL